MKFWKVVYHNFRQLIMRQLALQELEDKFRDYISDVEYSHFSDVKDKLTQLINFLQHQDISNRILERIETEYPELKTRLKVENIGSRRTDTKEIIQSLITPDLQGAFAYFTILSKFKQERKFTPHYIQLPKDWYNKENGFLEYQQNFNSYFLNPFKDLFLWYIYESKIQSDSDFFSYEGQNEMSIKLDELKEMLTKQGYGQEIIFTEIADLKKLTKKLNKKNWGEIIKGKFVDMALAGVLNQETAIEAIEFLTDLKYNLLT